MDAPPDEFAAIRERVAEALRILEDDGRTAFDRFVDERPDLAAEVRRRVRELSRLGLLASGGSAGPSGAAEADDPDGRRIGPYRLLERLGTGGMGVVFLAEHVELGRRVALKTLPPRVAPNPRARERFLRETRAVAALDHPGIVAVHEAGEQDGVPWFAMQFVRGRTLAEIVAALSASGVPTGELRASHLAAVLRGASADERAADAPAPGRTYVEAVCRLVHDVAEALQHAHAHGVLHRDVKPSNVLVTPDGRALLFDFGLADLESEASLTLTREFVGTPSYVSPEQIGGGAERVDARTDVYSLGVTLYELLTLRLPFRGRTTQQVLRGIQTREPTRPRRLNPLVPRDLETVCLTAMEKAKARRYASAADFAADLRRFLEGRPVAARPVGVLTRGLRFVRRHRAASAAALLGTLLLVGAPIALVLVNVRIQREADAARRAFAFLEQLVFESDAEEAGADATLDEVIGRAGERVLAELGEAPETRARLLTRIGAYFTTRGDLERAGRHLEEGLAAWSALRGDGDAETAAAANHLANVRRSQGRPGESEALYRRAAAAFESSLGGDHEDVVMALANLADLLAENGRVAEAATILDRVEGVLARRPDIGEEWIVQTLLRRARLDYTLRRLDASSAAYREAIDRLERDGDGSPRMLADAWGGWARVRLHAGAFDDAELGFRRQREGYAAIYGEESYFVGASTLYLGEVAAARGDVDEGVRLVREGIARYAAVLGEHHPWTLDQRGVLVKVLRRASRLDAAEEELEALRSTATALPEARAGLLHWLALQQAFLLESRGRSDEALVRVGDVVRAVRAGTGGDAGERARQLRPFLRACREEGFDALAAPLDRAIRDADGAP